MLKVTLICFPCHRNMDGNEESDGRARWSSSLGSPGLHSLRSAMTL